MTVTLKYVSEHGHQLVFSAKLISYLLQRLGLSMMDIDNSVEGFYDIIIGFFVFFSPNIVYFYMLYLMSMHHNF